MAGLTIGQVAKHAGVHVETIRYYQRLGLLELPAKPLYGFRRYGDETVTRLRFIKRAQQLGFSLKEIAKLLAMERSSCGEVRQLLEKKLAVVIAKIEDLERMRKILEQGIASCDTDFEPGCRLLEKLLAESA